jgi:hypothetical protein
MGDSSDDENRDETSSVLSDLEGGNLDPADTNLHVDRYMCCQDCPLPNTDDAMVDIVPVHVPVIVPSKCWLCTFSPHPIAVSMHSFIVSNVACMDFKHISSQVKHEILAAFPHAMVTHGVGCEMFYTECIDTEFFYRVHAGVIFYTISQVTCWPHKSKLRT